MAERQAPVARKCCRTFENELHDPKECEMLARLDGSYAMDAERRHDSYVNHNSQSLRKRAVAASNGHVRP